MDIRSRFAAVSLLAETFERFEDFAAAGMQFLGFDITEIQADIAGFMANGPRLRGVMAQRGEGKTALAALYAIWRLIHRPSTRVLIVSAGEENSGDTSTLITRIIMQWDILECLRPDRQAGDRVSTAAFDVNYVLKGLDRSPSVSCAGITSNLPGKRADLLIADDVESNKNGLTVTQRQQLLQATKEFSSICTHGDILYLGTPQSKDSVYNSLMGRGFQIRIWPGRYPRVYMNTEGELIDEVEKYRGNLAPIIYDRLVKNPDLRTGYGIDGTYGAPTDPVRFNDEDLNEKYLDKGPEDFQLQYMLDTSLADAQRLQLKLSDLVVANFNSDLVPEIIGWSSAKQNTVELTNEFPIPLTRMYYAVVPDGTALIAPKEIFMYVDPAGGGSDELAFACGFSVGPYIHIKDIGGVKGGLTPENSTIIKNWIRKNGVTEILCESNMGHGLFEINLRSVLNEDEDLAHLSAAVSGAYSTGQKEKRIIDSMVSAMQRHRVVVHQEVLKSDMAFCRAHSQDARVQYSVWYQLANITTDRDSLVHDDRAEAAAGVVRRFKFVLDQDAHKAAEVRKQAALVEFTSNPMGYTDRPTPQTGTRRVIERRAARRIRDRRR